MAMYLAMLSTKLRMHGMIRGPPTRYIVLFPCLPLFANRWRLQLLRKRESVASACQQLSEGPIARRDNHGALCVAAVAPEQVRRSR